MGKIGYTYLIDALELLAPPLGTQLYQGDSNKDNIKDYGQYRVQTLAKQKKIGNSIPEQIATAIKYQGIRLAYLRPIMDVIDPQELTTYITEKPNSVMRRVIWYLYEWLTDNILDIPDSRSTYEYLMDDKYYFTIADGIKDSRTRIINNCLGDKNFCPTVRKTKALAKWANVDMMKLGYGRLNKLSKHLNTDILGRSVTYLYTKETKSSTEIEREDSSPNKTQKFFRILKSCGTLPLNKRRLLFVQNQIINGHLKDGDYRQKEIYVGECRPVMGGGTQETIHYIAPKWNDVPSLMEGLIDMHDKIMLDSSLPSMIHAAILSFGLVYIHPFSDGNGRVHRYLIHDVLKARSTNREDFIIPVSAAILQHSEEYDSVLETISRPIMATLDFELIESDHSIIINNSLENFYRYPDFTEHVIFLYQMMKSALTIDLVDEIIFILKFDAIKKQINDHYDIENKEQDLLVKLLLQNEGEISNKAKKKYSSTLGKEALGSISEQAITVIRQFDALLAPVDETVN